MQFETETGVHYELDLDKRRVRRSHESVVSSPWVAYKHLTLPVVGSRCTFWLDPSGCWTTSTVTEVRDGIPEAVPA